MTTKAVEVITDAIMTTIATPLHERIKGLEAAVPDDIRARLERIEEALGLRK